MLPLDSNPSHQILQMLSDCEQFYSGTCSYVLYFGQNSRYTYFDDSRTYAFSLDLDFELETHKSNYQIKASGEMFGHYFNFNMYSE